MGEVKAYEGQVVNPISESGLPCAGRDKEAWFKCYGRIDYERDIMFFWLSRMEAYN